VHGSGGRSQVRERLERRKIKRAACMQNNFPAPLLATDFRKISCDILNRAILRGNQDHGAIQQLAVQFADRSSSAYGAYGRACFGQISVCHNPYGPAKIVQYTSDPAAHAPGPDDGQCLLHSLC
jgi:hypothetical protein